jgi:hypothetical protein
MTEAIAACFRLHLRCENCLQNSSQELIVPDVLGAPTTVEELQESGLLDRVTYVCAECEGLIGRLIAVRAAKPGSHLEGERRMSRKPEIVTIYAVIGYVRDRHGRLIAERPQQVPSAAAAERRAQRYADAGGGAIATEQKGAPDLGDWDEPAMIVHKGTVPRHALTDFRVLG